MTDAWRYISVFLMMLSTDFCWTIATRRIKDGNILKSGLWSACIMATSGAVAICYVENHWMLIPTCLGAAVGTSLGVFIDTRNQSHGPTL